MSHPRKTLAAAGVAVALLTAGALSSTAAATPPPASAFTVSIGSTAAFGNPTDTPANAYIDKDGTFYFQQSAALYGASDPRHWEFFSGRDFDSYTRNNTISDAVNPAESRDKNNDTTWRCNNSPTGLESTWVAGNQYSQKNFCDLSGVWVDPDTGHWYGLVHNEFTGAPFGPYGFSHYDAIDVAVSTNQGKVWSITGHAITSPYSTKRDDNTAFPNQTWDYGDGDQRLFVDTASGYFYVYYGSRINNKNAGGFTGLAHVARAPMSSKMATGSWQKWYNGAWTQAGIGGKESNMLPATSAGSTGYTPVANDYNPANTGTVDQQIAAGKLPAKADLFIMNITYNAYLGLYLGTPEVVSGIQSQRYYVTDDLATQKWYLVGDSGSQKSASWYRWFVDSANRTSSTIVGKSFRSYCSIACVDDRGGVYTNVTIGSTSPAPAPVDLSKTYTIGTGSGRVLAQVSGSSATTSVGSATGSNLEKWSFTATGDGAYRVTNASTGQALGVDSAVTTTRAWGTKPTATASTGSVGQQWFLVKNTSGGTYRLVNRHSGLVLGLSTDSARLAETTPTRSWTNTTGNAVGGSRTAAEQTLTLTAAGTNPGSLDGTHTLIASGKALDDPDHSTTAGTQFITWTPSGGANQNWIFTRQPDGSYKIANGESNLCMDVNGGSAAAGAKIIQWTCTTGANQRWIVTPLAGGGYTIASQSSGLLLTTASGSDGALVTQQADTNSALQHWAIG
ncbi:RICIN domain-containing protein [Longispora sp. NPDC051575]|uniref:RICIN domain-containing protein n=1 Tax=Longispora sp. NPDC051575 TaxID=3154943 RepID=UPI00343A60C0